LLWASPLAGPLPAVRPSGQSVIRIPYRGATLFRLPLMARPRHRWREREAGAQRPQRCGEPLSGSVRQPL